MYGQGTTPAGLQQAQNNPSRMTQVGVEMERGAKLLSCINEKVQSLYSRLDSVICTSKPSDPYPKNEVGPTLVGHACALSNHNDQLAQIDRAIADILDRLEL